MSEQKTVLLCFHNTQFTSNLYCTSLKYTIKSIGMNIGQIAKVTVMKKLSPVNSHGNEY